jgi:hypothetical protein
LDHRLFDDYKKLKQESQDGYLIQLKNMDLKSQYDNLSQLI